MYRVYVLRNEASRLYIGLSENVSVRLVQHNAGSSKWTAKYRPWTIFWQSADLSLSEARKLENQTGSTRGHSTLY
ncbi:MAG: GIY-YIG nuclease family protein [Lacunisphaera sp.]